MIINTDHFKAFGIIKQLIPEKIDPTLACHEKGLRTNTPVKNSSKGSDYLENAKKKWVTSEDQAINEEFVEASPNPETIKLEGKGKVSEFKNEPLWKKKERNKKRSLDEEDSDDDCFSD